MRIDGTPEASLRNVPALRDDMPPVVIVGAGWAGLSAALHLRRAGVPVQVLEAAPQAGGRARSQTLPWPDTDGITRSSKSSGASGAASSSGLQQRDRKSVV